MDYYESLEIVRLVVTGLVTAVSATLFVLIFRKPGVRDDYTRRWVNFTKAAIGLWSGARLSGFIINIIYYATRGPQWGRPVSWDVATFLGAISMYLDSFAQVSIFLALIYLAHALTQLRTDSNETSDGYRTGQKIALAAAALGGLLSVAVNTVYLAANIIQIVRRNDYSYRSWDATYRLYNAASIVALTEVCYFAVCGIGAVVYAVKARSKARGTPVRRAGSYLVVAAGMWLTRHLWLIIYTVVAAYDYMRATAIIDLFTNLCMIVAVLVLLFMMASQPRFSLARTLYKRPDGPERVL